jgi:LAGLIDADG endonuclease
MKSLVSYFECGHYNSKKKSGEFRVKKFENLTGIIIPFLNKYPIIGTKGLRQRDFVDFCKVADLMKIRAHKTPEGLEKIRKIKKGMNKGRK